MTSFVAALATALGGLAVTLRYDWSRRNVNLVLAFVAGILISIAILTVAPEALRGAGFPVGGVFILAGFLLLYLFQQSGLGHPHGPEEREGVACEIRKLSWVAWAGLFFHSFLDGLAISASFHHSDDAGGAVATGVILHKIPEGLTAGFILVGLGCARWRVVVLAALIGLASPAGAAMAGGVFSRIEEHLFRNAVQGILGITAGIFLYLGMAEFLPHSHRRVSGKVSFSFLLGVAMAMAPRVFWSH